jgi:hypothetical protein
VREEEAYDCGTIRRGECAKSEKVDQQIHVSQLASGSRWPVVTSYQRSSDRDAESASLINPINLQRLRATALGDRSEDDGDHEVSPTATTRIESDPACRRNFVLLDLLLLRCRWAGFTATLRLIACHPPLMIRDPCAWATRWIDQRGEASRRGTGLGCHRRSFRWVMPGLGMACRLSHYMGHPRIHLPFGWIPCRRPLETRIIPATSNRGRAGRVCAPICVSSTDTGADCIRGRRSGGFDNLNEILACST